jgi:hypothetical protein
MRPTQLRIAQPQYDVNYLSGTAMRTPVTQIMCICALRNAP